MVSAPTEHGRRQPPPDQTVRAGGHRRRGRVRGDLHPGRGDLWCPVQRVVRDRRERLPSGVLALTLGAVFLVTFLVWPRWDFVFRDPARLPMPRFYWVPIAMSRSGCSST